MNSTEQWFKAAEVNGECVDIHFGRLAPSSKEPTWHAVSHCECDGLGGIAKLLRASGADIPQLPTTNFSNNKIITPILNHLTRAKPSIKVGLREHWLCPHSLKNQTSSSSSSSLPRTAAWHLFSEEETRAIKELCRSEEITVNSLLLKLLDQTVRPDTKCEQLGIPWLIPVNTRGDVAYKHDTQNHVSCVEPILAAKDSAQSIQRQIIQRLNQGEHRLNRLTLGLTSLFPQKLKSAILTKSRNEASGNIGAFSNLGVWDSQKHIDTSDSWVFCPPVCKGQLLAAGCITFQNRLSLAIQTHSSIPTGSELAQKWIHHWSSSLLKLTE